MTVKKDCLKIIKVYVEEVLAANECDLVSNSYHAWHFSDVIEVYN